jgi:nucleotide-binding universal stress UspA family protein
MTGMKIVVALDGSDKGDAAVAAAAGLAEATGAEVLLLSVFSPWVDTAISDASTPKERLEEVTAARRAYLERKLEAFAGRPAKALVERLRWPAGRGSEEVAEGIARVVRERGADFLVVASKHAAGMTGLLLGSTAQALLRLSPCPVVVARPD